MKKHIFYWGGGLILSSLLCWGIGWIGLTSPTIYSWNPQLEMIVPENGTFKQQRDEGWAYNRFGRLGLVENDSAKLASPSAKTMIFGDSYIEANMIPAGKRMQNYLGEAGLGVGFSGFDLLQYLEVIPKYRSAIPQADRIVIFIGDISDILPNTDQNYDLQRLSSRLDRFSYQFRLYAFRSVFRRYRQHRLDFIGNKHISLPAAPANTAVVDSEGRSELEQLLETLKQETSDCELLIVYAPRIPRICSNRVEFQDEHQEYIDQFAELCRSKEIAFLNLGPAFIEQYRQTGRFPRGFFNTPVGEGHLNELGHRLAGEAIREFWEKQ